MSKPNFSNHFELMKNSKVESSLLSSSSSEFVSYSTPSILKSLEKSIDRSIDQQVEYYKEKIRERENNKISTFNSQNSSTIPSTTVKTIKKEFDPIYSYISSTPSSRSSSAEKKRSTSPLLTSRVKPNKESFKVITKTSEGTKKYIERVNSLKNNASSQKFSIDDFFEDTINSSTFDGKSSNISSTSPTFEVENKAKTYSNLSPTSISTQSSLSQSSLSQSSSFPPPPTVSTSASISSSSQGKEKFPLKEFLKACNIQNKKPSSISTTSPSSPSHSSSTSSSSIPISQITSWQPPPTDEKDLLKILLTNKEEILKESSKENEINKKMLIDEIQNEKNIREKELKELELDTQIYRQYVLQECVNKEKYKLENFHQIVNQNPSVFSNSLLTSTSRSSSPSHSQSYSPTHSRSIGVGNEIEIEIENEEERKNFSPSTISTFTFSPTSTPAYPSPSTSNYSPHIFHHTPSNFSHPNQSISLTTNHSHPQHPLLNSSSSTLNDFNLQLTPYELQLREEKEKEIIKKRLIEEEKLNNISKIIENQIESRQNLMQKTNELNQSNVFSHIKSCYSNVSTKSINNLTDQQEQLKKIISTPIKSSSSSTLTNPLSNSLSNPLSSSYNPTGFESSTTSFVANFYPSLTSSPNSLPTNSSLRTPYSSRKDAQTQTINLNPSSLNNHSKKLMESLTDFDSFPSRCNQTTEIDPLLLIAQSSSLPLPSILDLEEDPNRDKEILDLHVRDEASIKELKELATLSPLELVEAILSLREEVQKKNDEIKILKEICIS